MSRRDRALLASPLYRVAATVTRIASGRKVVLWMRVSCGRKCHCHSATSGSSHLLEGVFLGVSRSARNQKCLKLQAFSFSFRIRPGEPVKSISYGIFLRFYYGIFAQAIDPLFPASKPNFSSAFDFGSAPPRNRDHRYLILLQPNFAG
jgi:hypothetical protein